MNYTLEIYLQSAVDQATPMYARTRQEVDAALDRIIAAAATFNHNPAMYVVDGLQWNDMPAQELAMDVDPQANMAALRYYGPDYEGAQVSLAEPAPARAPRLYRDIDSATPFPANAAITLDQLRAAVHEFHESGGHRPTCVEWQPADGW
ncbi:Immunity protein Imm1 [Streptoalloteichus tenebrarius]|uniref:Immunity protein Imm1 n=1 Tax=Streptoalloteichus tenebrarius (strain ATCC 17920 / DSM 40477 / JCM 4838 / CBS 697.72 / NBRC 16177 / NCIMB 11028 / NRRL B-12390 / A12253. 1 / ISP 5477) TaxID=1933 RepID=A0ABT1HP27_STRSD|nr:Imm1 family immunity protein [Streptoalloteichus tenebrarius]MCP2257267.1 Immunity protein Imm1 [Streptoalloteichus tenebrarius]